jgi:hypothetical protein
MNVQTPILVTVIFVMALGVFFVAVRYDEARRRRIHLLRKKQSRPEPVGVPSHAVAADQKRIPHDR